MVIVFAIIDSIVKVLTLLVFVHSLLSYFMRPDHPIRQTIGMIIDPMLIPIRKIVPVIGGVDFSPVVLMILLQVIGMVLINILKNFV